MTDRAACGMRYLGRVYGPLGILIVIALAAYFNGAPFFYVWVGFWLMSAGVYTLLVKLS